MKKNGLALLRVTMRAFFRRRIAFALLAAVAAGGAFSAILLQNLIARQETALRDTMEHTIISCTVTNARGTDSGNLQMLSAFVEMLAGKRRERGCALDDYVKNVRAKAELPLDEPEGFRLCRILSVDSVPALSQAEGAEVRFYDGWNEEVLRRSEQVCLLPPELATADGRITVSADAEAPVSLQIVGVVTNGPANVIYCPFFMPWTQGVSVAFLTDSCSFDIRDNRLLAESKAYIYEWFVRPDISNQTDGLTFGVLVHDEAFQRNVAQLRDTLSMLRILQPLLFFLCGCIGFFASFLATRGRTKEFAVMRCIGIGRWRVFWLVMAELLLPAAIGFLLGSTGSVLLEQGLHTDALRSAARMTAVFLLGSAFAAVRITGVNTMKLMKTED